MRLFVAVEMLLQSICCSTPWMIALKVEGLESGLVHSTMALQVRSPAEGLPTPNIVARERALPRMDHKVTLQLVNLEEAASTARERTPVHGWVITLSLFW